MYLFICFWLCWVRLFSSCCKWGLLPNAVCGLVSLRTTGSQTHRLQKSRHVGCSRAHEHRLKGQSAQAQLLHGRWNLLRSGMEPVSSTSAGRFFTTKPPGKPCVRAFLQPKPGSGICQFPPINNELPNITNVLFCDQVWHGYQNLISGARGGLGCLGFHSCSECGPVGTQRQACKWPVLPNSLRIYLPTV